MSVQTKITHQHARVGTIFSRPLIKGIGCHLAKTQNGSMKPINKNK